jgi:hypothetical protein
LEKTKAEDEMREKLSNVTIGIVRLKSDIWITLSVIDFAFVSSALALTLTALQTSIYCVQRAFISDTGGKLSDKSSSSSLHAAI